MTSKDDDHADSFFGNQWICCRVAGTHMPAWQASARRVVVKSGKIWKKKKKDLVYRHCAYILKYIQRLDKVSAKWMLWPGHGGGILRWV